MKRDHLSPARRAVRNKGAAGSQYAMIVGLIAVVAILAVTQLGGGLNTLMGRTSNTLCNTIGGSCSAGGGSGGTSGTTSAPLPAPTVTSISVPSAIYVAGQTIPVTVTFSATVLASGSPTLKFQLDEGTASPAATLASGSGTSSLVFNYPVVTGDGAYGGLILSSPSTALSGGTITAADGINAATRDLTGKGSISGALVEFNPASVGGLAGWWDASDATTITQSSNSVSAWADKSGGGHNLSQSNASLRPTYSATGMNGKGTVAFTSSPATDIIGSAALPAGTDSFTVAIVWVASSSTAGRPYDQQPSTWPTSACYYQSGGLFYNGTADGFAGDCLDTQQLNQSPITVGTPVRQIMRVSFNASPSIVGTVKILSAGSETSMTPVNSCGGGSYPNDYTLSAYASSIGGNVTGAENINGKVSEVIVYNNSISDASRTAIDDYFHRKWGV